MRRFFPSFACFASLRALVGSVTFVCVALLLPVYGEAAPIDRSTDHSKFVGQSVLTRDVSAKFLKDGNEVLAEPGKLYLVERTDQNKVWVRGQDGWIDGSHLLNAKDAVAFFTSRLHDDPTAQNYLSRGQAWAARKNLDRALTDYDSALRLNPELAISHNGRGNCLLQKKQYQDSIAAYSRAIEIKPDCAPAYNNRGNAWRALDEFEKALVSYEAAGKLRPESANLNFSRGVCYAALGRIDEAIQAFDATLKFNPNHADALNQRGLAWQRKNDFVQAIASYAAAAKANPDHYEALNNLAWLLANCKQKELRSPGRAVEIATRACKVTDYRNWYCVGTLAASLARDRKFKEAVYLQKKALELMSRDATDADRADYEKRLKIYEAGRRSRS